MPKRTCPHNTDAHADNPHLPTATDQIRQSTIGLHQSVDRVYDYQQLFVRNTTLSGVGSNNYIKTHTCFSSILSGNSNAVYADNSAFIGAGCLNTACGNYSFIGNGGGDAPSSGIVGNITCADYSFIGNGYTHNITGPATGAIIGAGVCNSICAGIYGGIVAGCQNLISSEAGFIGAGVTNSIWGACNSGIVGGTGNSIGASVFGSNAAYSFIGGGQNNCIDAGAAPLLPTWYGFIGGGNGNTICSASQYSAILGGASNAISSCYASVGGGLNNFVFGDYSTVASGCSNRNSGCYSAILGGCGNDIPAGCQYVGVFGCNITNVCDYTFHVNCIIANGIPGPGAPPSPLPGTIFWDFVGTAKGLFICI